MVNYKRTCRRLLGEFSTAVIVLHRASRKKLCSCYSRFRLRKSVPDAHDPMLVTWFPVLVMMAAAGLVVGVMVSINRILGPKRPTKVKGEAFECGNPPSGSAWGRFSVRFYLTAILFLVFDVEIIFLYPWAVELRRLGVYGSRCRSGLRLAARSAGLGLIPE